MKYRMIISDLRRELKHVPKAHTKRRIKILKYNADICNKISTYKSIESDISSMKSNVFIMELDISLLEQDLGVKDMDSALSMAESMPELTAEAKYANKHYSKRINQLRTRMKKAPKSKQAKNLKKIKEIKHIHDYPIHIQHDAQKLINLLGAESFDEALKIVKKLVSNSNFKSDLL